MTFARRIGYATAVAVTLPLVFALLSQINYRGTLAKTMRTDRDREALSKTNALERLVVDMETASRGFRNGGDEQFLDPEIAAARDYGPLIGELRTLLTQSEEKELIDAIHARIDQYRSNFVAPLLQFVRTHPSLRTGGKIVSPDAPIELSAETGKRLMDGIRLRFEQLQTVENHQIEEDLAATSRAAARLSWLLWAAAGGFSIVFLIGAIALFRAYRRRAATLFAGLDAAEHGHYRAISLEGTDELARIAAAFDKAQAEVERRDEELRQALGEARSATQDLSLQQKTLIETQQRILEGEERARHDAHDAENARGRLDAVLASVGEGIYQLDGAGRVVYINRAAEKLLGYTIREISGGNMHALIHSRTPDGLEQPRESCPALAVMSTGLSVDVDDDYYQRKDGTFLPVEYTSTPIVVDGSITGAVVSFQDISVRKQAEAELRRSRDELETRVKARTADLAHTNEALRVSEGRYRLLFESNPQPMWVFDEETLAFLAVNDAACHHYGYTSEEFLTMTIRDIRSPDEVPALLEQIAGEDGSYQESGIWKHRRKDGSTIEVEISSYAFRFGERPGQLVLATDVTHRRQLEAQLRQSQKMEAIGQLAGGIAHDFNNLLTAILGNAELAIGQTAADSPIREDLDEIQKAGNRAAALTGQLLAFSRKQVVEPKVLDLNSVILEMDRLLRRLLGERVDLLTVPGAGLAKIKADPGQIEQVIMNLAVNARDAMPRGGRLTIETANVMLDEVYAAQHVGVSPGPYVLLAVSDTGEGMSAETQARIFEPFFTTKEKGKATGLGLSTVFGIVKQAEGHLWVYSEMGRGTSFKVYLPTTEDRVTPTQPIAAIPLIMGTETILLVEDEAAVRRLARITLEKIGYRIIEAENGDDALAKAKPLESVDLILSDAVMPGLDIASMVSQLRAMHPKAQFLLMSGYTDEAAFRHGLLEAGGYFLHKPFTSESLARRVREALDSIKARDNGNRR
jgi:two-component system cell cycle sensor histidine kinase/response regulator CckA